MNAYLKGRITHSEVCMHFVNKPKSKDDYDKGPVFFRSQVSIFKEDDAESLGKRVNAAEHLHQARITNLVVHGKIRWDGVDPQSLRLPTNYVEHLV